MLLLLPSFCRAQETQAITNSGTIRQSLARCPAAGPCEVTVGSTYPGVEAVPPIHINLATVTDRRFGSVTEIFHNWRAADPNVGAHNEICLEDGSPDAPAVRPGEQGGWTRHCRYTRFTSTSPGFNTGASGGLPRGFGPQGTQVTTGDELSMRVYGSGIKGARDFSLECYGVGDCHDYGYIQGTVGCTDASCEGMELLGRSGGEVDYNFAGPITEGGQNATHLRVACKSGCTSQGTGRYLIEETPAFPAGPSLPFMKSYAKGPANGGYVLTLDPSVALPESMVSTAWGTLTSDALVSQLGSNAPSTVHIRVRVDSAAGLFRKGRLVAIGGNFHELAVVAEAFPPAGANQELTIALRHSHPAGSPIFQGQDNATPALSATGTALRFTANDVGPLRYVFDVLGATDTTHLTVAQFRAGSSAQRFDLGNVYTEAAGVAQPLRRREGKLQLIIPGLVSNMALAGQREITIAGSTHFNGLCTDARIADPDAGLLTCTQPGPDMVDREARGVTVTVGDTPYGNTRFTLHRMAEVIDVRNPSTQALDGSLIVEPNEGSWLPGTLTQLTHHTSQNFIVGMLTQSIHDPYNSEINAGINLGFFGESNFGGIGPSNGMIALHLTNNTERERYRGGGGTRLPMRATQLNGLWESNLLMVTAPFPSGSTADIFGCPATGCDDTTYAWSPRALAGNAGGFRETWRPALNVFEAAVASGGHGSVFTQTPAGFRFSAPIAAEATDNAFEMRLPAGATSVSYTTTNPYSTHPMCGRPLVQGAPALEAALGGIGATWAGSAGGMWTLTLHTASPASVETLLDLVCFPRP